MSDQERIDRAERKRARRAAQRATAYAVRNYRPEQVRHPSRVALATRKPLSGPARRTLIMAHVLAMAGR